MLIKDQDKIVKIGFLKCDLYNFDYSITDKIEEKVAGVYGIYTSEGMESAKEVFSSGFKIVLPKGTKFTCTISQDEEFWNDDGSYGLEEMDKNWARKYLENIQEI